MAAGQQPTVPQFNSQLTACALQLRNLCLQILDLNNQVTKQGATGLIALAAAAGVTLSTTDANDIITSYNYMNTIAQIYMGLVQQGGTGGTGAIMFNFDDALAHVRGGQ